VVPANEIAKTATVTQSVCCSLRLAINSASSSSQLLRVFLLVVLLSSSRGEGAIAGPLRRPILKVILRDPPRRHLEMRSETCLSEFSSQLKSKVKLIHNKLQKTDNLDTSDPNDPDVIIKIDVSNTFNTTDRALTLDVINGRVSWDYTCVIKEGDVIGTVDSLTNLFGYFKSMRTCHSKLRYFDWDGQVHLAKGKTGGQEGDPLEMLIFNLTIHHLWGRVLAKFPEARAIVYADDGYIKTKLSIALQVLAEFKAVFKTDAGLELNVNKTSILPGKGVS
jgi:hypothetical protein